MALTIEDGTVVAAADSYQSLVTARADAANRGLTLNADDTTAEQQLRQAYYFLTNIYEPRIQGFRVSPDQTSMLPRTGMVAHNFTIASDSIPQSFLFAQNNIAASVEGGADLSAIKTDADLASFDVKGVYSESYQDGSATPTLPLMPAVSDFIKPYTKTGIGSGLNREEFGYVG